MSGILCQNCGKKTFEPFIQAIYINGKAKFCCPDCRYKIEKEKITNESYERS